MDRNNTDFNCYSNPTNFSQYDTNFDPSIYEPQFMSPTTQYEQAYMYYKYLTQQMDYRIKCKEYEKLTKIS